jgi:molecular chaperone DnaK (HSP70)
VVSFLPRDEEHYHQHEQQHDHTSHSQLLQQPFFSHLLSLGQSLYNVVTGSLPIAQSNKHNMDPFVKVGHAAKQRMDMHPHSTFYHAKRFLGRRHDSDAVTRLTSEVEFEMVEYNHNGQYDDDDDDDDSTTSAATAASGAPLVDGDGTREGVVFHVPTGYFPLNDPQSKEKKQGKVSPFRLRDASATAGSLQYYLSPEHVGSYVVSYLLHLTCGFLGYDHITSVVIAVPAKFTATQRAATAKAFQMAGLKVTRILEEPTAAALAYGLQHKSNVEHILVYDFGGGTLDVSVLRVSADSYVEVMASEGDDTLGGADFDSAIAHYLLQPQTQTTRAQHANIDIAARIARVNQALEHLVILARRSRRSDNNNDKATDVTWQEIVTEEEKFADICPKTESLPLCQAASFHSIGETLKIALSSSDDHVAHAQCLSISAEDLASLVEDSAASNDNTHEAASTRICAALSPVTISLTQTEFDEAVQSLYNKSLDPIRNVLKELDLTHADIDEVVMVGGTTRMPKIRALVQQELHMDSLNIDIDPDITVAYGAASVID